MAAARSGPASFTIGGQKPASDPTVVAAFNAFYDQIYQVMAMPDFHDTADDGAHGSDPDLLRVGAQREPVPAREFDYDSTSCTSAWPVTTRFCWIGLRHSDNSAKPAYARFVAGAQGVTQ